MSHVYLTGYKCYRGSTNKVYLSELHTPEGWKSIKSLSRAAKYCCVCSGEAMKYNQTMKPLRYDNHRVGIIVGTNITQFDAISKMTSEAEHYGANNVNPRIFPNTVLNVLAGHISIYHQIYGTNITLSNGQETGVKSLIYGIQLMEQNEVDRILICNAMFYPRIKLGHGTSQLTPEWVTTLILDKDPLPSDPCIRLDYEFKKGTNVRTNKRSPEFTGLLIEKADKLGLNSNLIEDSVEEASNEGGYKVHISLEGKH